MPFIHVSRSIEINASADRIYAILSDFNHWKFWSPWLTQEPTATVNISTDNKYYDWNGKRIGSGNMKIVNQSYLKSVEYDLNFVQPWKSEAKVKFNIRHNGDSCFLTWEMDSRLPLMMFWMKRKIETFISLDYERGLEMLKDYVELGEVPSEVKIIGEKEFEGIQYIGINAECSFDELGMNMKTNFEKMRPYLVEQQELVLDVGFSIYNNWDFKKKLVNYTSGFSVSTIPDDLSTEFISGSIPVKKVFTLEHKGAHRHIGNAWATGITLSRAKVYNGDKKQPFFEIYLNNPTKVAENELLSEIHFPLK